MPCAWEQRGASTACVSGHKLAPRSTHLDVGNQNCNFLSVPAEAAQPWCKQLTLGGCSDGGRDADNASCCACCAGTGQQHAGGRAGQTYSLLNEFSGYPVAEVSVVHRVLHSSTQPPSVLCALRLPKVGCGSYHARALAGLLL